MTSVMILYKFINVDKLVFKLSSANHKIIILSLLTLSTSFLFICSIFNCNTRTITLILLLLLSIWLTLCPPHLIIAISSS